MTIEPLVYLLWTLAAGVLGFLLPAVFAGLLHLRRAVFLIPYGLGVGLFLYGFVQSEHLDIASLIVQNWVWGIAAAMLAGLFLVRSIFAQPKSPRPQGARLILDLVWLGLIYGGIDALFLSVLPVLITWRAYAATGIIDSLPGQIFVALLALAASEFITIAYHAGYPEFRDRSLVMPAIGNGVCSLAYVLSVNPLSSVLSHIAMHLAAVWRGPERVAQLPPHYP